MVEGMEYLHNQGVAHMDIKLANFMLDARFNVKIIDFDLSYKKGDKVY